LSKAHNVLASAESDNFNRNPSTKGIPLKRTDEEHNPNLFNFDHCYDPSLTPRKGWQ